MKNIVWGLILPLVLVSVASPALAQYQDRSPREIERSHRYNELQMQEVQGELQDLEARHAQAEYSGRPHERLDSRIERRRVELARLQRRDERYHEMMNRGNDWGQPRW